MERLDLSSIENSRNRDKELFINKLINSENLVTSRSVSMRGLSFVVVTLLAVRI